MIFALKTRMNSPFQNQKLVSRIFTVKWRVYGLACLVFVVSRASRRFCNFHETCYWLTYQLLCYCKVSAYKKLLNILLIWHYSSESPGLSFLPTRLLQEDKPEISNKCWKFKIANPLYNNMTQCITIPITWKSVPWNISIDQ